LLLDSPVRPARALRELFCGNWRPFAVLSRTSPRRRTRFGHALRPHHILFVGVLTAFATTQAVAQKEVVAQEGGGIIEKVLVVPAAQLDERHALQISRQFLAKNKGRYKLQLLYIGGDEGEVVRYSIGKGSIHSDYEYWKSLHKRHGESQTPLALTTAMPGGAVLHWHDPRSGKRDRVVLEGHDTLRFRLGTVEFEILHVSTVEIPPYDRAPAGDVFRVSFYLRTAARFNKQDVRRATLFLQRRLGLKELCVLVSREPWFLADPWFPIVYRFDASFRAPSKQEWLASPVGFCMSGKYMNGISCTGEFWGAQQIPVPGGSTRPTAP
jgi:hypothetical protein